MGGGLATARQRRPQAAPCQRRDQPEGTRRVAASQRLQARSGASWPCRTRGSRRPARSRRPRRADRARGESGAHRTYWSHRRHRADRDARPARAYRSARSERLLVGADRDGPSRRPEPHSKRSRDRLPGREERARWRGHRWRRRRSQTGSHLLRRPNQSGNRLDGRHAERWLHERAGVRMGDLRIGFLTRRPGAVHVARSTASKHARTGISGPPQDGPQHPCPRRAGCSSSAPRVSSLGGMRVSRARCQGWRRLAAVARPGSDGPDSSMPSSGEAQGCWISPVARARPASGLEAGQVDAGGGEWTGWQFSPTT